MSLRPYDPSWRSSSDPLNWSVADPFIQGANPFAPLSYWGGQSSLINPSTRNEAVQTLTPLMSADLIESPTDFHVHVDMPGVENLEVNNASLNSFPLIIIQLRKEIMLTVIYILIFIFFQNFHYLIL